MSMFQPGAPASSAVHPSDSVADPLPPQRVELLDDPQEWLAFGRPCTPAGSPLPGGATDPATADAAATAWDSHVVLEGMHCAACALTVEQALLQVPGVLRASVGAASHRATVVWSATDVLPSQWMQAVQTAGYRAVPANDAFASARRKRETRLALWRWLVAGLCMMQVMMYAYPAYVALPGDLSSEMEQLLRWASWVLTLPVMLFSCGPFFRSALRDLVHVRISMDEVRALDSADVAAITTAALQGLSANGVGALSTRQMAAMGSDQWQSLSSTQLRGLSTEQVAGMASDDLGSLTSNQLASLSNAQWGAVSTARIAALGSVVHVLPPRLARDLLAAFADRHDGAGTLRPGVAMVGRGVRGGAHLRGHAALLVVIGERGVAQTELIVRRPLQHADLLRAQHALVIVGQLTGQPQHLPLARALQLYSGQKDQTALNALLAPVRTAAEKSKLLREWLETKRLFQPMAMSPQEAFRVLRETAVFQESGIIMKLPDWWRSGKGPRPAVSVTIDAPKQSSLHAGALLNFKIAASFEGEPLTDAEWEKLLSSDTGLVLEVDGLQLTALNLTPPAGSLVTGVAAKSC